MKKQDWMDAIRKFYTDHHKEHTLKHVEAVAETAVRIAKDYDLNTEKVQLAALMHDISAIMPPDEMFALAKERGMEMDAAEEKYHFLLHQRISKIIAQETFNIHDTEILSAIECHTTLKKDASLYDKVIFLADKLSWDQQGTPPYYDFVNDKLQESLDAACCCFIRYQFVNHLLLMPHRWITEAYEDLKMAEHAQAGDIALLTQMRIAYLKEDLGAMDEETEAKIRAELPAYFERNLNRNIFCYLIRDMEETAACAFLLVTEKPMSPAFMTGKCGTVMNVYTKPAYRRKGYGKRIMTALLRDAEKMNLSYVELKSTEAGYPLYKAVGFEDDVSKYHLMKWYNRKNNAHE